jgi:hypothetical protein
MCAASSLVWHRMQFPSDWSWRLLIWALEGSLSLVSCQIRIQTLRGHAIFQRSLACATEAP